MTSDAAQLIAAAAKLAGRAFPDVTASLGWSKDHVDHVFCHQVGRQCNDAFYREMGLDFAKDFAIYKRLRQHGLGGPSRRNGDRCGGEGDQTWREGRPRRLRQWSQHAIPRIRVVGDRPDPAMNGLPPIDRQDTRNQNPRSQDAGGLATLFPFRSRFLSVGNCPGTPAGHRLHYVDEGSGPVVVCLHGNPTWGFQFRRLIAELRGDFRVIVPDHIGCGLSDQPADVHFRAVDRIAHLEELFAHLGIGRFSLVMHDWGGRSGRG